MAVSSGVLPGPGGRLPVAPTRLIGRAAELATLDRLLAGPGTRLLTLTGPPGVGKTRLAIAAAVAAAGYFADGVVFVDLTAVRDPALVVPEVAGVLGVSGAPGRELTDRLMSVLAGRELLLVVDNCEHVLDAGPALTAPLAACPGLRMLATSRERLNVQAEREMSVPPLAVPGRQDVADVERFVATPSVAMLLDRLVGFQPDFEPTPANCAALAEICVRLDGLPLALELAAARLRLFTPGELTFRLRNRMGLLTGGARDVPDRHQTLRTALSWSHDLLTPDERAMFRRLSVFVGGAPLAAVQEVCAPAEVGGLRGDALAVVSSLIDKSLVGRYTRPNGMAEIRMLESLREYASELLAQHEETATTRVRHTGYYSELAVRTSALIGTPAETESVEWVGFELGNLRAALEHCAEIGDAAAALPLALALGWYAYTRGHLGQGDLTLDRALVDASAACHPPPDEVLAGAFVIASYVAFGRGELNRADDLVASGLEINERVGSGRLTAIGGAILGHLARVRGLHDEAVAQHERAGRLYEELGNAPGVAWSRYDLGLLARRRGELAAAAKSLRDGLVRFRELEYGWAIGCCAWALATVCLRGGETDEAAGLVVEALERYAAVDDGRGIAQCLEAAAALADTRGSADCAARLLGAAEALRETCAAPLPDEERQDHHAVTAAVRRALEPPALDRAWHAGRLLTSDVAISLARDALSLRAPDPVLAAAPDVVTLATPLTVRERAVADLVAAGRTNRQIGRTLGIAEKTSEVHVHNIIKKLGVRSRTEVATWVVRRAAGDHDPG